MQDQNTTKTRNTIHDREVAAQIVRFQGIELGDTGSPTDVDGFIEWRNKLFIFFELKYRHAEIPLGQRLAYERLTGAVMDRPCIVFLAKHSNKPPHDVWAAKATVTQYCWLGNWFLMEPPITLKEAIERFIKGHGEKG